MLAPTGLPTDNRNCQALGMPICATCVEIKRAHVACDAIDRRGARVLRGFSVGRLAIPGIMHRFQFKIVESPC